MGGHPSWPLQTEHGKMRGSRQTRKTARGYCSRKEPDEDPKRREKKKKGKSDHMCMLESVRIWRQRRKGSKTMPGAVPAAMLAGGWKIRHEHAPVFHWRPEGDTPVPLSPSVPTGKGKAENCESMLEAVAEASAWQAVWDVRLLPLHPAANAEAVPFRTPIPCAVTPASGCRVTAVNLVACSLSFLSPPRPASSTGNQKVLPIWAPRRLAQEKGTVRGLGTYFLGAHPE